MIRLLLVGAGGFVGAILRYAVSGWVQGLAGGVAFPWGTLGANLLGCLLIGVLYQLGETQLGLTPEVRLFFMVGLLGSFTTYSTFSNEAFGLFQDHRLHLGLLFVGLHLFLGLLAVYVGRMATHLIWG